MIRWWLWYEQRFKLFKEFNALLSMNMWIDESSTDLFYRNNFFSEHRKSFENVWFFTINKQKVHNKVWHLDHRQFSSKEKKELIILFFSWRFVVFLNIMEYKHCFVFFCWLRLLHLRWNSNLNYILIFRHAILLAFFIKNFNRIIQIH